MVKNGNQDALSLLGYSENPKIEITDFVIPRKIKIGESLSFSFKIKSQEDAKIVADYVMYFQNKMGKMESKKVFKLKNFTIGKNQEVKISKTHPFRANMTTRKIYPGDHKVVLQINGKKYNSFIFEVTR